MVIRYDSNTSMLHIVASRAIKEGDEITGCYVNGDAEGAQRRAELRSFYLFDCACSRCLSEPSTDPSSYSKCTEAAVSQSKVYTDRALQLFSYIKAGDTSAALSLLPIVLSKASVEQLNDRAQEAAAAMANFEVIDSDEIDGYTWESSQQVGSIARKVLIAAAGQPGQLSLTEAILKKAHTKAFAGKKDRKCGIACAFVEGCAKGVLEQVRLFLDKHDEALASEFRPLGFVCRIDDLPTIPAWQQGLAEAYLNGHDQIASTILQHCDLPAKSIDFCYLVDDTTPPVSYLDAFTSYTERRMKPRCLFIDGDGQVEHRAPKRAKMAQ